jgi:predicted MPP superfamily phosphohydrolase
MRAAWLTDIHLNFLTADARQTYYRSVGAQAPDVVLLTGDISEAPFLHEHLAELADALRCPVYFVLGNHDFYGDSIAAVRARLSPFCATHPSLSYLNACGVVPLTPNTALLGHDGWGDARLGDYWHSPIRLNDDRCIHDLVGLDAHARLATLHRLGEEAAQHLDRVLREAVAHFPHILLVTHVPPFHEACWYQGQMSDKHWLPFFCCGAVGAVLRDVMQAHPQIQLTVLCGHTHNAGTARILPNLVVHTGAAEYGHPSICEILPIR